MPQEKEERREESLFCLEITPALQDTVENSRLPCRPSKAVQFRASKDSRKGVRGWRSPAGSEGNGGIVIGGGGGRWITEKETRSLFYIASYGYVLHLRVEMLSGYLPDAYRAYICTCVYLTLHFI